MVMPGALVSPRFWAWSGVRTGSGPDQAEHRGADLGLAGAGLRLRGDGVDLGKAGGGLRGGELVERLNERGAAGVGGRVWIWLGGWRLRLRDGGSEAEGEQRERAAQEHGGSVVRAVENGQVDSALRCIVR